MYDDCLSDNIAAGLSKTANRIWGRCEVAAIDPVSESLYRKMALLSSGCLTHQWEIVKQKLSILRYLALAAFIVAALAFGATQTPADAECRDCTQPPPTACLGEQDPNAFCNALCVDEYQCESGVCRQYDQCLCATK